MSPEHASALHSPFKKKQQLKITRILGGKYQGDDRAAWDTSARVILKNLLRMVSNSLMAYMEFVIRKTLTTITVPLKTISNH